MITTYDYQLQIAALFVAVFGIYFAAKLLQYVRRAKIKREQQAIREKYSKMSPSFDWSTNPPSPLTDEHELVYTEAVPENIKRASAEFAKRYNTGKGDE